MKKIILPLVTLTSLALPLAMSFPSKANALEIELGRHRTEIYLNNRDRDRYYHEREHYSVYYRRPYYEHWRLAGNFRDRYDAERTERELREQGYVARVERD